MHPVERCRFRSAQIGSDIFDLIPEQSCHAAVRLDGGLQFDDTVGCGHRRGQVLKTVFDPLHGAGRDAGAGSHQNDIGEYSLLDPETAAGIRRGAQSQLASRNLQRTRDYGMNRKRTLEVRLNVISGTVRIVFGQNPVGFHRRAGIAGIADLDRDAAWSSLAGGFWVTIAECAFRTEVVFKFFVQDIRVHVQGGLRVDHRR